jgi:putative heme iron utilization protein
MYSVAGSDTFSPRLAARHVLRVAPVGSLATLRHDGFPFASLVTVATTSGGEPILLLSRLAVHTQNLERDRRASLLLVEPGGESGDPLAGARLTVVGEVGPRDPDPALRRRFIARHAEAAGYANFADFGFRKFTIQSAHLVAGFGRIVNLGADQLITDVSECGDLLAAEESAIDRMNEEHGEALRLYATRLLDVPDRDWRMTGVDPDGIDLRAGALRARLDFQKRAKTAQELREALIALARAARSVATPRAAE